MTAKFRATMGLLTTISGAALLVAPAAAQISDPVLMITATNADGTAVLPLDAADGTQMGNSIVYSSMFLQDGEGDDIATLGSATVSYNTAFPRQLSVNFAFTAGASNTSFEVSTGLFSFAGMANSTGFGSSSYTVTDSAGSAPGATFTATGPDSRASRLHYNGLIPAGTLFANYVQSFNVPAGGSVPSGEFSNSPIPGSVNSMSFRSMFMLSAGDQVSGNITFTLIPEPSTLGLAAVGLLGLLRRR